MDQTPRPAVDVFISYTQEEREAVRIIDAALQKLRAAYQWPSEEITAQTQPGWRDGAAKDSPR